MITGVFKRYHSGKTFLGVFTYKMAAKINWHRYGTKLRHCHRTYNAARIFAGNSRGRVRATARIRREG